MNQAFYNGQQPQPVPRQPPAAQAPTSPLAIPQTTLSPPLYEAGPGSASAAAAALADLTSLQAIQDHILQLQQGMQRLMSEVAPAVAAGQT